MKSKKSVNYDDIVDVSHLISKQSGGKPLVEIEVKPKDQVRVMLGNFTQQNHPKGFSVEYSPSPDPENSMVSRVTSLESADHQRLILHIANYGSKPRKAAVTTL